MTGCDRYEWERVMRRARLGSSTKYVGMIAAQYGSRDGSGIFPGVARLAAVTELSERTVRTALGRLRDLGLIERVREGSWQGRRALADEYRLTIPADLLERVDLLDPDEAPATVAADPESSPEPAAGDHGDRRHPDSPMRGAEHRQLTTGSPATDAGTPATDDRITGNGCRPPKDYPPTYLPTDQRGTHLREATTEGDDLLAQLIKIDEIAARRRGA